MPVKKPCGGGRGGGRSVGKFGRRRGVFVGVLLERGGGGGVCGKTMLGVFVGVLLERGGGGCLWEHYVGSVCGGVWGVVGILEVVAAGRF